MSILSIGNYFVRLMSCIMLKNIRVEHYYQLHIYVERAV